MGLPNSLSIQALSLTSQALALLTRSTNVASQSAQGKLTADTYVTHAQRHERASNLKPVNTLVWVLFIYRLFE